MLGPELSPPPRRLHPIRAVARTARPWAILSPTPRHRRRRQTTIDAALANDNNTGGVTIIPSDGLGNFGLGRCHRFMSRLAPFTVAVASDNFDALEPRSSQ